MTARAGHRVEDGAMLVAVAVLGRHPGWRSSTRKTRDKARLIVAYPRRTVVGCWYPRNVIEWAAQYYEYHIGVPTKVEHAA